MMSPARKAPSATDRPTAWVRAPVPRPTARTTSRNSSSLCVRATRRMSAGTTRAARNNAGTSTSAALPNAIATAIGRSVTPAPSAGSKTVSATTARSSTSEMPIMTRPWRVCSSPRSMSSRTSTIVLATEMTSPMTSPCPGGQPSTTPAPAPSAAVSTMPSGPPSSATHRTRSRSRSENSMPTENISRTTPISANSSKVWVSDTVGPGVKRPTRMPPTTYPRIRGWRASHASAPPATAATITQARSPKKLGSVAIGCAEGNTVQLAAMTAPIRVLIAKVGLDGHDRGVKIVARALRDAGMDVIYTGLHRTPEEVVAAAVQEDVDAIGISILSGAHLTLVPRIVELLRQHDADDTVVVVGGVIPDEDVPALKACGVADVVLQDAPPDEVVRRVRDAVAAHPRT